MLVISAVLLPTLLLFSWMIWRSYENERSAMEREVVAEADALSRLVDSFWETREAVLRTLVTSRGLESDLAEFHARAKRAVPGTTEWIVLADERGKMLVHTEYPYGTVLPDGAGAYLEANAAGHTYISNLLARGPATGKPVLFIAIPVRVDGIAYSLHYVVTSHAISSILQQSPMSDNRIAAIIDRDNKVAARNRRTEDFVGKPATVRLQQARSLNDRGKLYDRSLEGIPSVAAFNTSPRTGWSAIVAAPSSDLFTPARNMLRVALIALAIVTGFALTLAISFGSRLVKAVNTLVVGTQSLAAGDLSALPDTGMNETDHVVRALREASLQLRAREAEIARSRDEALEASRVKDEFLATLSHELRTPLNPVLLLATDGAADLRHSPETRAVFATIAKSVALEARLIDDMLDVTRITRDKLSLDLRDVELHEVLRDALTAVELDFSDKQLKLLTEFSSPVWVSADSVRLQQVFWNLLKNAAKFSPPRATVEITTRKISAEHVEVSIADEGIGLTAEELARGFHRFEQGPHHLGGLGLGLAISKSLVDLHGGSLVATSPGRDLGATFTVRLPIIAAPKPTVMPVATPVATAGPGASSPSLLLVEDHESTRIVLARLLTRRGYDVVPAGTMGEALALFPTREFTMIISDIGLPDGDGCTLLQTLQAIRPVVAVAVSGYGMEEDVRRSSAAGFVDHLVKPVTIEALNRALTKAQQVIQANSLVGDATG